MARAMVTQYGMSSKLGAVKYGTSNEEPFLGRDDGSHQGLLGLGRRLRSTLRFGR